VSGWGTPGKEGVFARDHEKKEGMEEERLGKGGGGTWLFFSDLLFKEEESTEVFDLKGLGKQAERLGKTVSTSTSFSSGEGRQRKDVLRKIKKRN